jgi:hypothetical protein
MKTPAEKEGLEWVAREVRWSEIFIHFHQGVLNLYAN